MTRTLFTVGSHVYELNSELREYFINKTTNDETIDAWFEGTVLWHSYEVTETDYPRCVIEEIDMAEVFDTLTEDAIETLDDAGAKPVFDVSDPISAQSGLVKVKELA